MRVGWTFRRIGGGMIAAAVLLGGEIVRGDDQEFDFKDSKRVNSLSFFLDSELEPIMGVASGISGKISYDPKARCSG